MHDSLCMHLLIMICRNNICYFEFQFIDKMDYSGILNKFCDGLDPYNTEISKDFLPTNVTYFDLVNYLIYQTHSVTNEQFRSYKSLQSYKTFQSGWVQEMGSNKISTGVLVRAKVN